LVLLRTLPNIQRQAARNDVVGEGKVDVGLGS